MDLSVDRNFTPALNHFTASCVPQPLISGDFSVLDDVIQATSSRDTIHAAASSRIYPGSKGYTHTAMRYRERN